MSSLSHLPTTTIIIPQFYQPELTIHAIQSLRNSDPLRWPIIVVENGSSPASLRQLHSLDDPDTEILSLSRQGLTAAWNRAASRCRTSHLLFLNNDTHSWGPWVESLLAPLTAGLAGLAGVESRVESHVTPAIKLLAGWCFAVRTDAFRAVGGFDESLGLYFSDTDFQLRIRDHDAGTSIPSWTVVSGLPITHLSHRTAHQLPHQRALWMADRDRFLSRWPRNH